MSIAVLLSNSRVNATSLIWSGKKPLNPKTEMRRITGFYRKTAFSPGLVLQTPGTDGHGVDSSAPGTALSLDPAATSPDTPPLFDGLPATPSLVGVKSRAQSGSLRHLRTRDAAHVCFLRQEIANESDSRLREKRS